MNIERTLLARAIVAARFLAGYAQREGHEATAEAARELARELRVAFDAVD